MTLFFLIFFTFAVADSWDTENPERISLPTYDPSENFDVKCIAGVGDKVWVGAGPSIFVLDGETLSREVSWHLASCVEFNITKCIRTVEILDIKTKWDN